MDSFLFAANWDISRVIVTFSFSYFQFPISHCILSYFCFINQQKGTYSDNYLKSLRITAMDLIIRNLQMLELLSSSTGLVLFFVIY